MLVGLARFVQLLPDVPKNIKGVTLVGLDAVELH